MSTINWTETKTHIDAIFHELWASCISMILLKNFETIVWQVFALTDLILAGSPSLPLSWSRLEEFWLSLKLSQVEDAVLSFFHI